MNKEQLLSVLEIDGENYHIIDLKKVELEGYDLSGLPKTIKILLEGALRNYDGTLIEPAHIDRLLSYGKGGKSEEVPFVPGRIVLQDFTGVPAVVDLAAMREAVKAKGKDPKVINPRVQVDLIVDHSVMVDDYGKASSLDYNVKREFERNGERYKFLKWAQESFENFRAVPPATGIIHQVNLEYLAKVVASDDGLLYPDTLVGTDSHTTMINGIGVLGWGVGGIEAEAGMLGQPVYLVLPEVVGVKLTGQLKEGVTSTDLALTVTNLLRQHNVVGKFVEFFGPGVVGLSLPDRATVSNMAPEYGATMGYFPVDDTTIDYLGMTGRDEKLLKIIQAYMKHQGLYGALENPDVYTSVVELDLTTVEASLAGPKRPQDKIPLSDMKEAFIKAAQSPVESGGFGLNQEALAKRCKVKVDETEEDLIAGAVVLAAITSCTNTSNPSVMLGAGLLAKKAVDLGLRTPAYVKTSLTPGSQVVTEYLKKADVLESLEKLGFYIAGYGCATCIGNSGPLNEEVTKGILDNDLLVASVLSGNRNFEGRIHPHIKANYLASPILVVAYALAGRVTIDFENEPIGLSGDGKEVYLKDIWPSQSDIQEMIAQVVTKDIFVSQYKNVYDSNNQWNAVDSGASDCYQWEGDSSYIREPDFFKDLHKKTSVDTVKAAKALLYLGDSITTDHISPAGAIGANSPAGLYLKAMGVEGKDFNSYGSRRGNHEVMMRGTFANVRIRNKLSDREGGYTLNQLNGKIESVYDAAMAYKEADVPLIVLAGKEYGTGSSRDWAAKGTNLLGVKAVIAKSYERIHRSNLVGMGVLPLEFMEGQGAESLGLTGKESFEISGLREGFGINEVLSVIAKDEDSNTITFEVRVRIDSQAEIEYYLSGGILHKVLLDDK